MRKAFLDGMFAVNKPSGPTSMQVVDVLKGIIRDATYFSHVNTFPEGKSTASRNLKMGHGGTLDAEACGVLVVGIGRSCKRLQTFLKGNKRYHVKAMFGMSTDSQYSCGNKTQEAPYGLLEGFLSKAGHINHESLVKSLEKFEGRISQVPPQFCALKYNGIRISDRVRLGMDVDISKKARSVDCYRVHCLDFEPPYFTLDIFCGSGFYVRSLIEGIGKDLGSCACVVFLLRTECGPFTIEDCLQYENWNINNVIEAVKKSETMYQTS